MADRRKDRRVTVNLAATYRSTNLTIDAQVHNLSKSGLFLACPRVDAEGTRAEVVVTLPDHTDRPVVLTGRVVWSEDVVGMGVSFGTLPRDAALRLANFIVGRMYRG